MKIAFTSCLDAIRDDEQAAWIQLQAQNCDHVVLLGDNIYMDYKFGRHLRLGEPARLGLADFSGQMHSAYSLQWAVDNFRKAIERPVVHAIWDDHDFAWNNSRGAAPEAQPVESYVSPAYRRLSRALFDQYRATLRDKPAVYPPNPFPTGVIDVDLGGIQSTVDLTEGIRLHLLDGRSFRGATGSTGSLLGQDQRMQLELNMIAPPGLNLLASGTTLSDWREYGDYAWLKELASRHRIVILGGDIHQPGHSVTDNLVEATASAMAQPQQWFLKLFGKRSEVFGTVDISPARLIFDFWQGGQKVDRMEIDRATWSTVAG